MTSLTHIGSSGEAHMVDVSTKDETTRVAVAGGKITMNPETLELIREGDAKKGDVLGTARLAGIMASKRTHELIPLCHPLALSKVSVSLTLQNEPPAVLVETMAKVEGKTGVEMEALTACSIACLTIYDMVKAVDRGMVIGDIRLLKKSGGKSGDFTAEI